jgi:heme A synthase
LVEFTHRITSGIAFLLVIGLLLLIRKKYGSGHPTRYYASMAMGFMILEALIGAGLVLFELVAFNTSGERAAVGALHLLNTFLLLGSLTAVIESMEEISGRRFVRGGARGLVLAFGMLGVLLVGMSGAITALGDTLFPSESFFLSFTQDFAPNAHFLLRLRVWHPVIAVIASLFIFIGIRLTPPGDGQAPRIQIGLTSLVLTQLFAGVLNLFLLAPVWLQIVHLLLADLIWVSLIVYIYRTQRVKAQL